MKSIYILSFLFFGSVSAQISTGKVEEKPKPVTKKVEDTIVTSTVSTGSAAVARRIPTEGLDEFSFYFGMGRVYSNRNIVSNVAPFGEDVGLRANEEGYKTLSFQVGVRNRFSSYLSYDIGLALERFGESYAYDDPDSDSAYSYKSRYSYYALPLQVFATYGKDFRFFLGGGIQPQLFANFRQEQELTTKINGQEKTKISPTDGFNQFVVGITLTAGVQWRMGKSISLYCLPTFIWNQNSTYDKQADFIHKSHSFNLKFGFMVSLPN